MFKPYANVPVGNQNVFSMIIGNSQTIAIGDALTVGTGATSSFVFGAGTASSAAVTYPVKVLGVCVGFTPINQTGGSSVTQEVASYVAASNNQTVAAIRAKFIPARLVNLWVADTYKAVATATTTGSGGVGYFNIEDNASLKEGSYVVPNTEVATYTASTLSFASMGSANNFGTNYTTAQVVGMFNLVI